MRLFKKYLLASMALGLVVPIGVASGQSPTVSIESGSAHGPKINGNFVHA